MMTRAKLLDNLARAIDAPREQGRLENIKKAFAEYTASLRKPRWKIWGKS